MPRSHTGPPVFHTLAALDAIGREHPTARKLLIAPDRNWGRDILLNLARRTGGWVGWEVTTLREIAGELAFVGLDRERRRIASDLELVLLVDRALEEAVAAGEVSPRFAALAGGLGFRAALRDALLETRTAGVTPGRIAAASGPGTPARDLAVVLSRYEQLLAAGAVADIAAVFAAALAAFDTEAPFVLGGLVVLAPDLRSAGLPGQLLDRLIGAGARPLPADETVGLAAPERSVVAVAAARGSAPWPLSDPPPASSPLSWLAIADEAAAGSADAWAADTIRVDLAAAATPSAEVREALRRALAEGRAWDQVELAVTDPDTYGVALDALCRQLGIGYSALHGLPLARTRMGRALDRWLRWIENGLPAEMLREALEAGDLEAPGAAPPVPPALARMLRSLEIGWGRARYAAAVERLRDPSFAASRRRDTDDEEDAAARVARRERTATSLAELLERLLAIVPDVPERGSDDPVVTTLPKLAEATLGYLALVPVRPGGGEEQPRDRLTARLAALAATESPPVRFSMALAQLRDALSDLRAWTELSDPRRPRNPSGGRVHLTDLAHAGISGRERIFVLGLDADRTGGATSQDPILNDAVRRVLESDGLPPTAVRRQEHAWVTGRALARLRGTVTLSYAAAGDDGERATGPAHVLLQTLRVMRSDAALTYDDLREALGAPACAVPDRRERVLDDRDVWLAAIGAEALLLDGDAPVRARWPGLAAALQAADVRRAASLTEHHGLVAAAAGRLDPRNRTRTVSASSLELLGKCPMAWFYRYGLNVRPPADPEYDPEVWLDPMNRGSLLHSLYERVGAAFHGRQHLLGDETARVEVLGVADALLAEWHEAVPPPSESVYQSEAREIRESALAFLDAERLAAAAGAGRWHSFELDLGSPAPTAVVLPDGGTVDVTGRVDRVDAHSDGRLTIIDFKTGKPARYEQTRHDGPFKGGRLLQAVVYAAAVEARGMGQVRRFEYRFPTLRGENHVVHYEAAEMAAGRAVLVSLLDHLARGEFIATDDPRDCGYCDYGAVCRAARSDWTTVSARAEWGAEFGAAHPAYAAMIARRAPGPA